MTRSWILSALLLLLAGACSEPELVLFTDGMPEEVAWVGAIFEDREGAVLAATGLAARSPGSAGRMIAEEAAGAAFVRVVGYSAEQLASVRAPDERSLRAARLRVAGEGGAALPEALWSGRAVLGAGTAGGEVQLGATSDGLRLGADWISCPEAPWADALVADVRCSAALCELEGARDACTLRLAASGGGAGRRFACPLRRLDLVLDARGVLEGGAADGASCAPVPAARDAALSLACGAGSSACAIDVYTPPFEPRFSVETAEVLAVPERRGDDFPGALITGYLAGIVALEDRIAVGTHDGRFAGPACSETRPDRVSILDAESLMAISTATVPACLGRMLRDPLGDGFIAVFGGGSPALARVDRLGRTRALVYLTDGAISAAHTPAGAVIAGDPPRVAALYTDPTGAQRAHVLAFDLASLEQVSRSVPLTGNSRALTAVDSTTVVVADNDNDAFSSVNLESGAVDATGFLESRTVATRYIPQLEYLRDRGDFLVSVHGDEQAVFLWAPGSLAPAHLYEWEGAPYAFQRWPVDQELVLAGFTRTPGDGAALLALVDLARPAVLPGAIPIGFGIVGHMDADRAGRVWLTLPWSGRVARVAPVRTP